MHAIRRLPRAGASAQSAAAAPVETWIGGMIRMRREELGLPQAVLADRVGLAPQQIGRIERGEDDLRARRLIDLAAALGVDVSYFVPPAATVNGGPDLSAIGDAVRLVRAIGRISRHDIRDALVTLAESHSDDSSFSVAASGALLVPRPARGAPPLPPPIAPSGGAEAANPSSHGA